MEKRRVDIFKASGKWYTTIFIDSKIDKEQSNTLYYDQIGQLIREEHKYNYCQPRLRTLDSWFAVTEVETLPIVIWFWE